MRKMVADLVAMTLLLASCATSSGPPTISLPVPTTTTTLSQTVKVFYGSSGSTDCNEVQSYTREVPVNAEPIKAAFDALVAGPAAAESGATSWFSEATAGSVRSAILDEGHLTVDLDDLSNVIPGASSSCGSAALLAQLKATGFQFEGVSGLTFQFEGSCEAFFQFLQMECDVARRSDQDFRTFGSSRPQP